MIPSKEIKYKSWIVFTLTVLFISLVGEATAATYYASPGGSGIDCKSGSPCTLHYAVNTKASSAGDTVLLKDGTYTASNSGGENNARPSRWIVKIDNNNGTSSGYITIKAENKWGAILDGESTQAQWWTQSPEPAAYGIFCGTSVENDYIRIEDIDFTGFVAGSGIYCASEHAGGKGDYWYIKGNRFHDIGRVHVRPNANPPGGGSGIFQGVSQNNWTVDGNLFYTIGPLNQWTKPVYSGDVCTNKSLWHVNHYDPCTAHGHGIYIRGSDSTYVNNIFYDIKSGWSIKPSPESDNIIIANNTFVGSNPRNGGQIMFWTWSSSVDITVDNNIFVPDGPAPDGAFSCLINMSATVVAKNNLMPTGYSFYNDTSGMSVCSMKSTYFTLSGNLHGNVDFVDADNNNYALLSSSDAIDRGLSTHASSTDHAGNSRPVDGDNDGTAKHDIGAYEFAVTVTKQSNDGFDNDQDGSIMLGDEGSENAPGNDEADVFTHNSIKSFKTTSPVLVDGNLSEDEWDYSNHISFENPSRSDNNVQVYTGWDDDNLYFAYNVTDNHKEAVNTKLHIDDGVEIYIDTKNDKSTGMDDNDYFFIANINDLSSIETIEVETITTSTGYTTEIAIPWSIINTIPSAGMSMGLLLANNDRDNSTSSQFDWMKLIETGSYARPNFWGNIAILDNVDNIPPAPPTALIIE